MALMMQPGPQTLVMEAFFWLLFTVSQYPLVSSSFDFYGSLTETAFVSHCCCGFSSSKNISVKRLCIHSTVKNEPAALSSSVLPEAHCVASQPLFHCTFCTCRSCFKCRQPLKPLKCQNCYYSVNVVCSNAVKRVLLSSRVVGLAVVWVMGEHGFVTKPMLGRLAIR